MSPMPLISAHSAMVLPLVRIDATTSVIFSGEIETFLDDPTLTTDLDQEEVIATVEESGEVVTSLEQDELVVEVEEDTV